MFLSTPNSELLNAQPLATVATIIAAAVTTVDGSTAGEIFFCDGS